MEQAVDYVAVGDPILGESLVLPEWRPGLATLMEPHSGRNAVAMLERAHGLVRRAQDIHNRPRLAHESQPKQLLGSVGFLPHPALAARLEGTLQAGGVVNVSTHLRLWRARPCQYRWKVGGRCSAFAQAGD
eukprot:scaffold239559_cov30-Tisochrysis_lutea.AAC.3